MSKKLGDRNENKKVQKFEKNSCKKYMEVIRSVWRQRISAVNWA